MLSGTSSTAVAVQNSIENPENDCSSLYWGSTVTNLLYYFLLLFFFFMNRWHLDTNGSFS